MSVLDDLSENVFDHENSSKLSTDRSYYYTNQNYEGIYENIMQLKLDPSKKHMALFIGEGHIFELAPALASININRVLVIDYDQKVIDYKRMEKRSIMESSTPKEYVDRIQKYFLSTDDYLKKIFDSVMAKQKGEHTQTIIDSIFAGRLGSTYFKLKELTDEVFQKRKAALSNIRIDFILLAVSPSDNLQRLVSAINNTDNLVVSLFNRTNIVEYTQPHMRCSILGDENDTALAENIKAGLNTLSTTCSSEVWCLYGITEERGENTYMSQGWASSMLEERDRIENNKLRIEEKNKLRRRGGGNGRTSRHSRVPTFRCLLDAKRTRTKNRTRRFKRTRTRRFKRTPARRLNKGRVKGRVRR